MEDRSTLLAPSVTRSTCPWHDHVAVICRPQSSTRSDRVKRGGQGHRSSILVLVLEYSQTPWAQPVQYITYCHRDVLISADTSDQPSSGMNYCLQPTSDWQRRHTRQRYSSPCGMLQMRAQVSAIICLASVGTDHRIDSSCHSWQKQLRSAYDGEQSCVMLNDSWASKVTSTSLTVSAADICTPSTQRATNHCWLVMPPSRRGGGH